VKLVEKALGVPVSLINDVDAGICGEYHFGAAKNSRTAIGVFPGTGIGGGAVINGELLRAFDISCMEIGHVPVMPGGPLCGCGQRGCVEAVAGRLAIASEAAAAAHRGAAPNLLQLAGTDIAQIRSKTLAKAVAAGDTVVEEIVRQAARHIGHAVAVAINLLAADCVVLGGGLVEALPKIFQEEVESAAKSRVMASFRNRFKVATAKLGDDAAIFGAAWFAKP
jgi:glucokinase